MIVGRIEEALQEIKVFWEGKIKLIGDSKIDKIFFYILSIESSESQNRPRGLGGLSKNKFSGLLKDDFCPLFFRVPSIDFICFQ